MSFCQYFSVELTPFSDVSVVIDQAAVLNDLPLVVRQLAEGEGEGAEGAAEGEEAPAAAEGEGEAAGQ